MPHALPILATRARRLRASLPWALLLSGACGGEPAGPVVEPDPLEGLDLDGLFAPATPAEAAAVAADWAGRTPTAQDVVTEHESLVEVGADSVRVRIVSHVVDGSRHVGAVLSAKDLPGPAPVIVYAHGGDAGVTVESVLFQFAFVGQVATELVWVVPSFRSESIGFAGATWTSQGDPSPWDRDVDDALALLEVALQVEPAADPDRIGVLGFSRGATVGMLMGIRDPRIDRIVEFFGPTDFFGAFARDVVEDALRGSLPSELPGFGYLDDRFIQPFGRRELSAAQLRPELVRRSPVLFAERLPALQLHHGRGDPVVSVSQAEALIATMTALGRTAPDFEATLYDEGGHNPLSLPGSILAAIDYLSALLPAPATR